MLRLERNTPGVAAIAPAATANQAPLGLGVVDVEIVAAVGGINAVTRQRSVGQHGKRLKQQLCRSAMLLSQVTSLKLHPFAPVVWAMVVL